jgi:predicted ATPase/DNA-binding SARP family transcriptional activator
VDVRILGPLEVWDGSEQLVVDSPRQRSILALLAVTPNVVVSVDRIVDELWGDTPPESAQSTVRYHVSKLRSALGDAAVHVVTRSPGYVLEVAPDTIDVHRFEAMAAEGRGLIASDPERAARVLINALSMWRGPALADFAYESFARAEIVRLEEMRLAVVEDRIEADLASGRHIDLVGELDALVGEYPLRERLWGELMTALYRTGRQAEALRAYQQAREALAEVGIEPSEELRAVEERVLQQDPLLSWFGRPVRCHNLPERLSSFIGRTDEVAGIAELLGKHRLITLTGIGGVGKTSLAIEASRAHAEAYEHGVWLVPVADVGDPDLIVDRVAQALGVQSRSAAGLTDQLGGYLAERHTLLVFDGCEPYIDAVASVVESLLGAAPNLRVVATSREPLDVVGECRFEVEALDADSVESDAIRLFTDRARLVQPGFAVTTANADLVGRVCGSVAGLPLAVELAAARLSALSLAQIDQRLDDQMALLVRSRRSEERHRSLGAAIGWSYDLLNPAEQALFRRFAVFRGGATAEAAELVCADAALPAESILDILARLVDVSLLVADRESGRFAMLDPVRQYAAGQLSAASETKQMKSRHAGYYRDLARQAFDGEHGPDGVNWFQVCAKEEPNHVAAITWTLEAGEPTTAVETGAYLTNFWNVAGRVATEESFLGTLVEEARKCPSRELVILLSYAAYRSPVDWLPLAEEALQVARELDDDFAIGWALRRYGGTVGWGEDFARGVEITRQAFEHLNRIGHPEAISCLLNLAGMLVRINDDTGGCLDEAEAAAQELLVRATELQSPTSVAYAALGWVAIYRGDLDVARSHILTSMQMAVEEHADRWIAHNAHLLVGIELATGNLDRAFAYHEEFGPMFNEIWGGFYLSHDGAIQIAAGDTEAGIQTLLDALDRYEGSSELETVYALIALAGVPVDSGDGVAASRLYAAAETLRKRRKLALAPHEFRIRQGNLAKLSAMLGDESFAKEWAKGEAMTTEEAVAYAHTALDSGAASTPT